MAQILKAKKSKLFKKAFIIYLSFGVEVNQMSPIFVPKGDSVFIKDIIRSSIAMIFLFN